RTCHPKEGANALFKNKLKPSIETKRKTARRKPGGFYLKRHYPQGAAGFTMQALVLRPAMVFSSQLPLMNWASSLPKGVRRGLVEKLALTLPWASNWQSTLSGWRPIRLAAWLCSLT